MRTIRYRAWHKKNKKMYYVEALKHITYDDGMQVELIPKLFDKKGVRDDGEVIECNVSDVELMECVGKLDKNGIDIYEDDILKAYKANSYLSGDEPLQVIWDKEIAGFIYDDSFSRSRKYLVGNNKAGAWCLVVGNIYENPNLLKEGVL